ncbi:MAG TPA: metallophosphoesterase [Kofleriaceae bacterium]
MGRFRRRIAIALAVLISTHAYVWWRFVAVSRLPTAAFVLATVAIVVLAPSMPIASIAMRRMPRARAAPWLWLAYTWFGSLVYLLPAAALTHVASAVFSVAPRDAAAAGIAAVAATVAYGLVHARRGPFARHVRVPLSGLPAAAEGYRIVQLTDVHIGWTLGRKFAASVVAKVNALAPDLIVLTGDLVDGQVRELAPDVEPFRELRARDGVYAVTGNHEYYWNVDAWIAHFGSLGLRFLRNERVRIRDAFELAGVDDITSALVPGHGEDIAGALAGRDPALPVVLLAHHPSSIERAAAADVSLQLSGHTHGGQLLPLGWLSRLFEPHVAGLARFGATWLYVSQGTGFWGPPLRVGTSCEISVIELVRAQGAVPASRPAATASRARRSARRAPAW